MARRHFLLLSALNYLRNQGQQCRALPVDYRQDGSYQYVYALWRETVDVKAFRAALDRSLLADAHRGYLEMRPAL